MTVVVAEARRRFHSRFRHDVSLSRVLYLLYPMKLLLLTSAVVATAQAKNLRHGLLSQATLTTADTACCNACEVEGEEK